MSMQKREKFTGATTPEKPRHDKPFIQIEGKLTEAQLEAIAGGKLSGNHNESVTSIKEVVMSPPPPEKPCPQQSFVQIEGKLTQAQLEAIAGGGLPTN